MQTFVEVAVNIPQVSGVFHYHLPQELKGQAQEGHIVLAPFGSRTVQGVILGFVDQPMVAETRPILELVDLSITLTRQQIELAREMADEWLAPLAACISLMLPPGLEQQADHLYTAHDQQAAKLSEIQKRLLHLLYKRGPLRGQQIDRALQRVNWRAAARPLIHCGLLTTQPVLSSQTVKPKLARTVQLACLPQQAEAALSELGRAGSPALARRQAMLRFLIHEAKPVDVAWLYAESAGNSADLQALSKRGLISFGQNEVIRDPLGQTNFPAYEAPELTADQKSSWQKIQKHINESASGQTAPPILLHGVTGSGKTEIYLRAVQETLALGRQAIVLVPEIALTPQTVQRFAGRFPGQVGLVHSGLSIGERFDTWRRARLGELSLVVGPRSALFSPFPRLGLIVVDECHDDTYHQPELAPHYHARDTAISYARLANAVCLMGSATPDLVSVFRSQQPGWQYLRLPARILAHRATVQAQLERLGRSRYHALEGQAETIDLPPVSIIDMREELKAGNRSIFSRSLHQALGEVLDQKQQAILFLNRRGSATYVFCRDCGYTLRCPRCNIPFTYHEEQAALLCHYCSYQRKMPKTCPSCNGVRIRQFGTGTQKVETELQHLFPSARTLRWDYETTRKKGAHAAILSHFSAQRADVLIGTQMLAKGMDLPLVTLVGAVLADVGLNLPDYRANERTFQVLTQVSGRAGRSPLGGRVILQTFQPDHYVIQAAACHDYQTFYHQELAYRRQLGYPPFSQLVRLEYRHTNEQKVEQAARDMAKQIQGWLEQESRRMTRIIGPAPCFFSRLGGNYRWQIVLCGPDPAALLRGRTLGDWKLEVNPPNLL